MKKKKKTDSSVEGPCLGDVNMTDNIFCNLYTLVFLDILHEKKKRLIFMKPIACILLLQNYKLSVIVIHPSLIVKKRS
jgi:hypothetical protein